MNDKDAGPVAFAAIGVSSAGDVYHQEGMLLRDWFAGQALAALATREDLEFADLSSMAYRLADAMIAERSKP